MPVSVSPVKVMDGAAADPAPNVPVVNDPVDAVVPPMDVPLMLPPVMTTEFAS
jgi:hypothetical protein